MQVLLSSTCLVYESKQAGRVDLTTRKVSLDSMKKANRYSQIITESNVGFKCCAAMRLSDVTVTCWQRVAAPLDN